MAVREAGREINVDCVNEQKKKIRIYCLLMHLGSLKSGWRDRPKRNGTPRDQLSNCGISLVVHRLWLTLHSHCTGPGFNP